MSELSEELAETKSWSLIVVKTEKEKKEVRGESRGGLFPHWIVPSHPFKHTSTLLAPSKTNWHGPVGSRKHTESSKLYRPSTLWHQRHLANKPSLPALLQNSHRSLFLGGFSPSPFCCLADSAPSFNMKIKCHPLSKAPPPTHT